MAKEKVDRNKELRNNRKSEILNAAKALFIEHGWEKTTIRQIVTSANTSIGNFYFYFSNKRALMEDLIDELLDDIRFDFNEVYSSLATNTMKLAAASFILTNKLTQSPLYVNLFQGSPGTRLCVMRYYREGLQRLFESNPELINNCGTPKFAALAWEAVCMVLLDYHETGDFDNEVKDLIPFLIRWNLMAIKTPDDEIDEIMNSIMQYFATHAHELKTFSA